MAARPFFYVCLVGLTALALAACAHVQTAPAYWAAQVDASRIKDVLFGHSVQSDAEMPSIYG